MPQPRWFRRNGLTVVVLGLFLAFWGAQTLTGHATLSEERADRGQPPLTLPQYLGSAHFWEATTENWESEFLQMGLFVLLTRFFFQKGSSESKDPDAVHAAGHSRTSSHQPREPPRSWLYEHSLSLALLGLFLASWIGHGLSGCAAFNAEQRGHHQPEVTLPQFLVHPQFWFQSFQNWQSEFLAIGAMVVLTIFLREKGSAQSKDVDAPDGQTGE